MKSVIVWVLASCALLGSCSKAASGPSKKVVVGFSQCDGSEPWRKLFDEDLRAAAAEQGVELLYLDAAGRAERQNEHVASLVAKEVDALLISPLDAQPLTAAVERATAAGVPVFVLDRNVNTDAYVAYVSADNTQIGRAAGEHALKLLGGQGKVVEIWGLRGSTPAQERHKGFRDALAAAPGVQVIAEQDGDWKLDLGKARMQALLKAHEDIDLVYAHNDPMAVGAWLAAREDGREKQMKFLGIDGNPGPEGGAQAVLDGKLTATFLYPTPGRKGLEVALAHLRGERVPKVVTLPTETITPENAARFVGKK